MINFSYARGWSKVSDFLFSFCWLELLPYELVLLLREALLSDARDSDDVDGGVLLRHCGGVLGGVRLCGGVRLPSTGFRLLLLLLLFSTGLSCAAGDEDLSVKIRNAGFNGYVLNSSFMIINTDTLQIRHNAKRYWD